MNKVGDSLLTTTNSQVNAREKMLELFDELLIHDGFGEFRVEVKILKRKQKEVIIHSGKQFRFVVDVAASHADNQNTGSEGLR